LFALLEKDMKSLKPAFAVFAFGVLGASSFASFTVATFADPATGSSQNFISVTPGVAGSFDMTAAWTGAGLNLLTPGTPAPDFPNATFQLFNATGGNVLNFTPIVPNLVYQSGPGVLRFFDNASNQILQIGFASSQLTQFGWGASDSNGNAVVMTGSIAGTGWSDEQFGFAFANTTSTPNGTTLSASFTSSAVPEPATLAALGLGAVALMRRRRSK
jgi:hypothetical protein